MPATETDAVDLFADGLTLVYHEARHVRFLIDAGHISAHGWGNLTSLPRNRVDAWRDLQSLRHSARCQPIAVRAAELFAKRFGRSLEDLARLYENPHWKHAGAIGGHEWRRVTACVRDVGQRLDQRDVAQMVIACESLLQARHNNGLVRDKIRGLDHAIGFVGGACWE